VPNASEFLAEVERLGYVQDLRKDHRIDDRGAVELVGHAVIGEHHERIQSEHAEHHCEIKKHRTEMPEFAHQHVGGFGAWRGVLIDTLRDHRLCLALHGVLCPERSALSLFPEQLLLLVDIFLRGVAGGNQCVDGGLGQLGAVQFQAHVEQLAADRILVAEIMIVPLAISAARRASRRRTRHMPRRRGRG